MVACDDGEGGGKSGKSKGNGKGKAGGGKKGKKQRNLSGCPQAKIVEDEMIGDEIAVDQTEGDEIVSQNDLLFQDRLGDGSIIGNDAQTQVNDTLVDARQSTSNEYFSAPDGP
eukprot:scaffold148694_cov60-Attheya_sp.AAC.4